MADAAPKLMTAEEFLAWQQAQEERYELVDGVPVLMRSLEMMTGASGVHDRIVTNVIAALHVQLRGSRCRPTTADISLRTKIRSFRRPDVTVTCDPPKGDIYEALEPRLVIEVLSPSNAGVGWERKMAEYRRHAKLDYILLIDAQVMAVTLNQRTKTGWDDVNADAHDDVLAMPKLKCKLSMAEIYDGTGLSGPG